jgi:hypothetical protein
MIDLTLPTLFRVAGAKLDHLPLFRYTEQLHFL